MNSRNLSIRASLALLILFSSAFALLLASLGFGIYERDNERASAVREVTALADTLASNTAASLAFNDQRTAQDILAALRTEPHILRACLYDLHGNQFAEYRAEGAAAVPANPRADGAYFDSSSLKLYRGVVLEGERTGTIELVFSLQDTRSQLHQYVKIACLVLLFSVAATFLASLWIADRIGRPLVDLAELVRRVSVEKNYSLRANIRAGGETGLLIQSFNEMLSRMEVHERALKDAMSSLQESEERYALAAKGANDGLWDWNLVSGEIYFSPRWNHMLGYAVSETWSTPEEWFRHIHPEDRARVQAEITAHRAGETAEFVSEYRMLQSSGKYSWMLSRGLVVRNAEGKPVRMAGSQTDITEGKIADPLTGIPNRLYFMDRLESAIESFRRDGSLFGVLFVDLDHFKIVNDSLGHAAGDDLLVDVARRLKSSLRREPRAGVHGHSVLARVGGDEFAILVSDLEHEGDLSKVATRMLERLNEPFQLEGRRMFISASIGIALSTSGQSPEDLIRNADTAMYQAKANGKGRAEFFTDEMRERVVVRFETEAGLRRAIDANQLVLHYQPIFSAQTDRIAGFEALVRWLHPERGLIAPAEFIPIAEESDLIVLLGRWVMRNACRQMAHWHRQFPEARDLRINVNMSSRQLSDPRLLEDVKFVLEESGLAPDALSLEITESSLIGNVEETVATLRRLKSMRVKLEIDDFGTGYSSLSYLRRLPFDTLKVDHSFIRELRPGGDGVDIVKAIVEMAHSLHLHVIAEGVETAHQLHRIRELGCEEAQGFFLSRPLDPVIVVERFFAAERRGCDVSSDVEVPPVYS